MKILLLSFRLPYPLIEGFKLRAYHIARILSQKHHVDLLSLHRGTLSAEHRSQLDKIFRRVILFPHGELSARLRALSLLPTRLPLQLGYYRSPRIRSWIQKHHQEYDLFFCLHLRMAPYCEAISAKGKKVIDFIDATSLFYCGAAAHATGLWRGIYRLEAARTLRYEARLLCSFDRAFISSSADAEYLLGHAPQSAAKARKLIVLPNGVREELLARRLQAAIKEEDHRLVFLGKMDYAPNVDAVSYFVHSIFPKLRARDPRLEFWIVGTSPRPTVSALERIAGVRVTGFLEDPFALVERAKLVIAPLRYGAGIQNKVLEAMALGKAVLATSCAVRGIEGRNGVHFRIVRGEDQWLEEVPKLLREEETRKEMGQRARQLVQERYRWAQVGERLLAELDALLQG